MYLFPLFFLRNKETVKEKELIPFFKNNLLSKLTDLFFHNFLQLCLLPLCFPAQPILILWTHEGNVLRLTLLLFWGLLKGSVGLGVESGK